MSGSSYQKRVFALNGSWTPIVSPIDANYFTIRNTGAVNIKIRTMVDDETTEDLLAPGAQDYVNAQFEQGQIRFPEGTTVVCVASATGAATTCAVTWVR